MKMYTYLPVDSLSTVYLNKLYLSQYIVAILYFGTHSFKGLLAHWMKIDFLLD